MICVKCGSDVPDLPFCGKCGWKQDRPVPQRRAKARGNGLGTVYRRNGAWTAMMTRYSTVQIDDETGKKRYTQKRHSKGGFATKKEALAWLEGQRQQTTKRVPKLIEYWTMYEADSLPKLSSAKQSAYRVARRRLDSIMGLPIDVLTVADLRRVVKDAELTYYPSKDMRDLLSNLYQLAMADQVVTNNIAHMIVLPELNARESEPFTADEVQTMWAAFSAGNTFIGYMLLMIYSGMMPGELLALKKSNIDLDKCEIWKSGLKTKERKEKPIVFPEFVRPVVEALMDLSAERSRGSSDKLAPWPKDRWYDAYHAALKSIGVRDLPPYSCRHTTGTEAARAELPAPMIQKLMRHAKITTSQRYIHLDTADAHDSVNQLPGPPKNE